jgi:hypothetical protein
MKSLRVAMFAHLVQIWYKLIGIVASVIGFAVFIGLWAYFESIWR